MYRGYIKVWRKMLDNPIFDDPDALALWVRMLLKATHKDIRAMWNGNLITLKPGQFISGRKVLARQAAVNESKVYRLMRRLKANKLIEQQSCNVNSLYTIINWKKYQVAEQQSEQADEQPVNNERTTSEQRVNTNKNVNNSKNVKNDNNIYKYNPFTGEMEKDPYADSTFDVGGIL